MKLFRDARSVTSSLIVGLALTSIRSILLLRFLGPALMGAWKSALLLDAVGEFVRMTFSRAMGLRVPMLDGQQDQAQAKRCISAAGALSLYLGLVLGLITFAISFIPSNADLRTALRLVACLTALGQPYLFLRELAAARHFFHLVTRETLIRSIFDFVAGLALCFGFGLRGLGASAVLSIVLVGVYLRHQQHFKFGWKLDVPEVRGLLAVGVPYSLSELTFEVLRRLDGFLIALLLGPVYVGYYGISLLIAEFSIVLARKGVNQVISPHLLREFGRTGSFQQAAEFYEKPLRLFCYTLPPLLAVGSLVIGEFVQMFLPQYTLGITAARITMWTVFFVVLHSSINSFFVASEMILTIWKTFALLIPFGAVAQILTMRAGFGLPGAAVCSLSTLAIVVAVEIFLARRRCGHRTGEIFGYIASMYLPMALAILLSQLAELAPIAPVLQAVLFLVLYTPVLLMYESRFSILREVRQTI